MQTGFRINWLTAIALLAIPAALALVGLSATATRGDDGVHTSGLPHGNVDCDGGVDVSDVLSLLGAVSGAKGAPRNCEDYDGYTNHGCITPVIPNPTACDMVWLNWITIAPGEDLPVRYDINCDGEVNISDVLALLLFTAGFPGPTPTCLPTGSPN